MARKRPQRRAGSMTEAEINAYLDARKDWAILTTIGPDGYPHSVALGYFRLGDDLYLGMRDQTQKVKNVERNPRASVLVSAAKGTDDISGVLIQGDATLVRDPDERLHLAREAARIHGTPEAEWPQEVSADGLHLKLSRRRVISWDYH